MSIQEIELIHQDLSRFMNPSRRKLLFLLDQQSTRKLSELSRLMGISDRTCKASAQRLFELGLVHVREGQAVGLTQAGKNYVNQLKVSFRKVVTAGAGD